jgi:hypothetical protein
MAQQIKANIVLRRPEVFSFILPDRGHKKGHKIEGVENVPPNAAYQHRL